MARPRLGSAAKNTVGSVRLTRSEAEALEEEFDTVNRALRALVNDHLAKRAALRKKAGPTK
jgi:hypothetical protein